MFPSQQHFTCICMESNLKILERNKINFCDARFSSRVSNTPQHTQQLTQTCFTLSTPASLSVCKFSAHYPHKISCSVMRIKQLILDRNLSDEKQNSPNPFTRKLERQFGRIQKYVMACLRLKGQRTQRLVLRKAVISALASRLRM